MESKKNSGQAEPLIFFVRIRGKAVDESSAEKKFFVQTEHFVDGEFHGIKCREAMRLVCEVTEANYRNVSEGDKINFYALAASEIKDAGRNIIYNNKAEVPKGTVEMPKWKLVALSYMPAIGGVIYTKEREAYFQDLRYTKKAMDRCLWPMGSFGYKLYKRINGEYKLMGQHKKDFEEEMQ